MLDLETLSNFDKAEPVEVQDTYEDNTVEKLINKQHSHTKSADTEKMALIRSQVSIEDGGKTPGTVNADQMMSPHHTTMPLKVSPWLSKDFNNSMPKKSSMPKSIKKSPKSKSPKTKSPKLSSPPKMKRSKAGSGSP